MRLTACLFLSILLGCLPIASSQDSRKVSGTFKYTLHADEGTRELRFRCLVPQTVHGRQLVESVRYSPPPERIFREAGGQYAEFFFEKPASRTDINVDFEIVIQKYDLGTAQAKEAQRRFEPAGSEDALKPFFEKDTFQETDDLGVVALAQKSTDENQLELVRKLLTSVTEELKQGGYRPEDRGAVEALKTKDGDCTDYSDLFIALCRVKKIPARTCEGYLITPVARDDTAKHDWAEVYLKDLGWVPFDPFHVDLNSATFESMRPIYILLSTRRNDPVLGNYHYWYFTAKDGKVRGEEAFFVRQQRDE